jgi:hypothetical protein
MTFTKIIQFISIKLNVRLNVSSITLVDFNILYHLNSVMQHLDFENNDETKET